MTRKQLSEALLISEIPTDSLLSALAEFGWDSEDELVLLRCDHVTAVSERFLRGEIPAGDVSDWADALESREDIGFEDGCGEILADVIYELANPELTRSFSSGTGAERIYRLGLQHQDGIRKTLSYINNREKKRMIQIDGELFGKVAEISESKQIPPEVLIDSWLKEKVSEAYQ